MGGLHLRLLGAPQAQLGERVLSFPTRKALALLLYLAVEGGAHTRAQLVALLWPDSDSARGRLSLRRALGQLRDVLGERPSGAGYLRVAGDTVQFVADEATLDLALLRFPAMAPPARAALEAALASYGGDFLDGFGLPNAPEFDTWVSTQREWWHRQLALALDLLSALALASGDLPLAVATAQRWTTHDPLDEAAHRRLIEVHAAMGSRTLALQAYAALQALLARELGLAPAAETTALIERLRHAPEVSAAGVIHPYAPAQLAELPLIGRADELGRLIAAYRVLRTRGVQVVAIEGEAGIGKTRLALEFMHWATAAGADVLHGRAFEAGGRVPYQPLVDALRPRLDRENAPDDLLDDIWLAELARLLPELRARYPDLAQPSFDETTARIRLFESVVALCLSLCARAPNVWFIDDIQWADAASLDLLRYCVRRLTEQRAPLLVVCTVRSEDLASNPLLTTWMSGLERDGALRHIDLASLSAANIETLLAAFAPPQLSGGEDGAFARWLFAETGGQPLYLVETLKALIDRGMLKVEARAAQPSQLRLMGDLSAIRGLVPPTVRAVIRTRIAQLSPDAQALLAAAAVLGHAADFDQLGGVAGLALPASLAALDEALQRRLLVEQAETRHSRYTFAHDKIRDVVYTEAGDARRRAYHRRAFAALAHAPAPERAHHALAGGLAAEACAYSIQAGDEALRVFAVEDAISIYEQARALLDLRDADLGVATSVAQIPQLYLQLGRAYELRSALDRASAIYQELLALARERAWDAAECAALNRLATTLAHQAVNISAAIGLLHEAQALAQRSGNMADLAETEWNLAQIHFYNAQPERTHAHGMAALELARAHDMPALAARSLNVLALASSALARCGMAARYAEEASLTYTSLGNHALQADSMALAGSALINQGRVEAGLQQARDALAINRTIGNVWGMVACTMTMAGGLCDAGRYGEALAAATEAGRLVHERPVTLLQILALGVLGATQRAARQLDAARATHLEAWALVLPTGSRLLIDMIAAELCADCVLAGDMPAAAEYARAALEVRDYVFTLYMGRVQPYQTAALLWAGELDHAQEDLRRFGERVVGQPRYQIGLWQAQAECARHAGELDSAVAALEQALSAADTLDLPGEQWYILSRLASLYEARHEADRARAATARIAATQQRLAYSFEDAAARAAFLAAAAARK